MVKRVDWRSNWGLGIKLTVKVTNCMYIKQFVSIVDTIVQVTVGILLLEKSSLTSLSLYTHQSLEHNDIKIKEAPTCCTPPLATTNKIIYTSTPDKMKAATLPPLTHNMIHTWWCADVPWSASFITSLIIATVNSCHVIVGASKPTAFVFGIICWRPIGGRARSFLLLWMIINNK